jgi:outer membrane lipoprotein-sorting protein
MRHRTRQIAAAGLWAATMLSLPSAWAADPVDEIRAAHRRVTDLQVQVVRTEVRSDELKKMGGKVTPVLDFSQLRIQYRAPDKLRVEGKRGILPVVVIENGDVKTFRTALGIRSTRNVRGQPAKKQGGLELGLLSDTLWDDYNVVLVGPGTADGIDCHILELTPKVDPRPGTIRLWVDQKSFRVVQRDRYNRQGKLKHRCLFRQPLSTPVGVWLSRRAEFYNAEARFVGAVELRDVRVNQGIADSAFRG